MINYIKGDATRPLPGKSRVIIHICNTEGGWGAGFVVALSRRWTAPECQYRLWFVDKTHHRYGDFALGNVGWARVEPGLWVANMIAQAGYGKFGKAQHKTDEEADLPPIRYTALRSCLVKVAEVARLTGSTIHAPRIGCGLAGSSWDQIEPLIQETMSDLQVSIYDLP